MYRFAVNSSGSGRGQMRCLSFGADVEAGDLFKFNKTNRASETLWGKKTKNYHKIIDKQR